MVGITFNPSQISRAAVAALPADHMQRMAPPPKSVMGRPLQADEGSWLQLDSTYPEQMRERFQLLATRPNWVIDRTNDPRVPAAEAELRDHVVSWLTRQHPATFSREQDVVRSTLTGVQVDLAKADPLAAVAALASEDMLLMLPDEYDAARQQHIYRLHSGALLFPNGWSLRSQFLAPAPHGLERTAYKQWHEARRSSRTAARLERSLFEIHDPHVPQYMKHFAEGANRLFNTVAAGRIIWRRNWNARLNSDLFRHPDDEPVAAAAMTPKRLLQQGYVRSEHETFLRLPQSGAMVFGIKTYLWPLADMLANPVVHSALREAAAQTTPETQAYMGESFSALVKVLNKYKPPAPAV